MDFYNPKDRSIYFMNHKVINKVSIGIASTLLAVLCGCSKSTDNNNVVKSEKNSNFPTAKVNEYKADKLLTMKAIGPGNGGAMFGIGFKPDNPKVIIFGGDMGACYRTEDGGLNWSIIGGEPANQPHATFAVAFHPEKTDIVWAAGGAGLFKSEDAGKTWVNTHLPNGTYGAIGLDPDNADIAYVAEGMVPRIPLKWIQGRVFKTVDGGKTWKKLTKPESVSHLQRKLRNIITQT